MKRARFLFKCLVCGETTRSIDSFDLATAQVLLSTFKPSMVDTQHRCTKQMVGKCEIIGFVEVFNQGGDNEV